MAKFARPHPAIKRGDKERRVFFSLVGVTVCLLVVLLVLINNKSASAKQDRMASQSAASLSAGVGNVVLYAPVADVPPGTKLSAVELKEVYWPRHQIPEGAIRDASEAKALFAKNKLAANMPLVRAALSSQPTRNALALTKGYRAVAIDVDATSGIEGHALPGTRVDVVLTYNKDEELTSKVIVQNARVLSYGGDDKSIQDRELDMIEGPAKPSSTITLEVLPQDALKISTARQVGRLSLIMRATDDDQGPAVTEMGKRDLDGEMPRKPAQTSANCSKGRVKMGGREFMVGCDGTINQLVDSDEPR